MELCDSNVWLALVLSEHQHHRVVRDWFETIETPGSVCFCRATQQSLLRLVTTEAVMGCYGVPALTNRGAWQLYEQILSDDRIVLQANEPSRLESRWKSLALRDTASPKVWMDSYLAGLALASGFGIVTTDKAFITFSGLDLTLLGQDQ